MHSCAVHIEVLRPAVNFEGPKLLAVLSNSWWGRSRWTDWFITGGYFVLHYTGELIHDQILGQNFYLDKKARCPAFDWKAKFVAGETSVHFSTVHRDRHSNQPSQVNFGTMNETQLTNRRAKGKGEHIRPAMTSSHAHFVDASGLPLQATRILRTPASGPPFASLESSTVITRKPVDKSQLEGSKQSYL